MKLELMLMETWRNIAGLIRCWIAPENFSNSVCDVVTVNKLIKTLMRASRGIDFWQKEQYGKSNLIAQFSQVFKVDH